MPADERGRVGKKTSFHDIYTHYRSSAPPEFVRRSTLTGPFKLHAAVNQTHDLSKGPGVPRRNPGCRGSSITAHILPTIRLRCSAFELKDAILTAVGKAPYLL